jgi:23S rRNA (cytidine1920-2'-O)/16S rRNA (cytidine1409-2'-O)-methyltransferase
MLRMYYRSWCRLLTKRRLRVDELLVERGLFATCDEAQRACLAGCVLSDTVRITTPGKIVVDAFPLAVHRRKEFVSRGGYKLQGALDSFDFNPHGMRCVDLGASTGGFTDCLLQAGAASVVAIDVAYGQLAWALRNDERVTVFERTNIRTADPQTFAPPFDLAVADLSFISLASIVPAVIALLADGGCLIALIKPQFEADRSSIGEHGVVSALSVHKEVLHRIIALLDGAGLGVQALTFSPIKGPEGNIEFLVFARKGVPSISISIETVVATAHDTLGISTRL